MTRSNPPQRPRKERPDPDEPLLVSVPEAARLLNVGVTFAWSLVHRGELPSVKIGRRRLIVRSVLEQVIQAWERDQAQDTS